METEKSTLTPALFRTLTPTLSRWERGKGGVASAFCRRDTVADPDHAQSATSTVTAMTTGAVRSGPFLSSMRSMTSRFLGITAK